MALMLNAVFSENTASAHVESFVNKPEKHALFLLIGMRAITSA